MLHCLLERGLYISIVGFICTCEEPLISIGIEVLQRFLGFHDVIIPLVAALLVPAQLHDRRVEVFYEAVLQAPARKKLNH